MSWDFGPSVGEVNSGSRTRRTDYREFTFGRTGGAGRIVSSTSSFESFEVAPLDEAAHCRAVARARHLYPTVVCQTLDRAIHIIRRHLSHKGEKVHHLEESERYTRPHLSLGCWIQAAPKKLEISRDLSIATTIAERHLVNAGGVYNSQPFITGIGGRAPQAPVIEVQH